MDSTLEFKVKLTFISHMQASFLPSFLLESSFGEGFDVFSVVGTSKNMVIVIGLVFGVKRRDTNQKRARYDDTENLRGYPLLEKITRSTSSEENDQENNIPISLALAKEV